MAANIGRHFVFAWQDFTTSGTIDIVARRGGFPDGAPFQVDARAGGSTTGNLNGVLEVGRARPRRSGLPEPLRRALSARRHGLELHGPGGPVVHDPRPGRGLRHDLRERAAGRRPGRLDDRRLLHGHGQLLRVRAHRNPHTRPPLGHDLRRGALRGRLGHAHAARRRQLHRTCRASNQFYRFIETLLHTGVTGGCGGNQYCPTRPRDPRPDGGLPPEVEVRRRRSFLPSRPGPSSRTSRSLIPSRPGSSTWPRSASRADAAPQPLLPRKQRQPAADGDLPA